MQVFVEDRLLAPYVVIRLVSYEMRLSDFTILSAVFLFSCTRIVLTTIEIIFYINIINATHFDDNIINETTVPL